MAKGSIYRSLGRRRSPFSPHQFPYTHLGSFRKTTSNPFSFHQGEDWLPGCAQFKNGSFIDPRIRTLQLGDFLSFSLLSSQTYQRSPSAYHRQCTLAQSQRVETFLFLSSTPSDAGFFTTLFSRTQSDRKSMEDYASLCHTQSLLSGQKCYERITHESLSQI